jgi:glutaminyl-tRNA synthetase
VPFENEALEVLAPVKLVFSQLLANVGADRKSLFERHGYFVADRIDHVQGLKPVFNLAVG